MGITVPLGAYVHLRLSDDGVRRLEELTGTRHAEIIGQLLQWEPEVIVEGMPVRLLDRDIADTYVREADHSRNSLLTGAALGAGSVVLVRRCS